MWLWTDYCVNQAYSVPQGYDIFPTYNAFNALGYCRKYGISLDEIWSAACSSCAAPAACTAP
jgi:hypothetical protein